MSFNLYTPQELSEQIALKAKQSRLNQNLTQEGLASRSGVSLGSVKRFERIGQISLESLLKIALVLNSLSEFENLFNENSKPITSLDQIIAEPKTKLRGRVK